MKITDPEIIRTGERELLETVKGDLDWGVIGEIVKQRINISSMESTGGEIVVHENQVAFRIDFLLKMDLSLMFDRDGVLIPGRGEGQDHGQAHGLDKVSEHSPGGGAAEASESSPKEQGISPLENQKTELNSEVGDHTPSGAENQEAPGIEDSEFDLSDLDLTEDDLADEGVTGDEAGGALDDDIDEILKESREFWENKKNE
ncbi:MAG: hypothetical protein RBR67_06895 [Desulfobacterium sp.]|jgi:hypothetical protein|nr:hypothetical protein [Desulfobacterium sp.]